MEKSQLLFSSNVRSDLDDRLLDKFGIPTSKDFAYTWVCLFCIEGLVKEPTIWVLSNRYGNIRAINTGQSFRVASCTWWSSVERYKLLKEGSVWKLVMAARYGFGWISGYGKEL
ncbi:hypothetical protein M9H77_09121 [Catharanthus roseus]|uniref:Uncharacterized protein n=1 Tax=Catharanthus roseus TaxID=4058 RepID=A0ACC0BZW0_CATRO|nr:hypothetical protein M9H77_09121 [Catharanthus roseus]